MKSRRTLRPNPTTAVVLGLHLTGCATPESRVCSSPERPEWAVGRTFEAAAEDATELAADFPDVSVRAWHCGSFDAVAFDSLWTGTSATEFFLVDGPLVAGAWSSDVPLYCDETYIRHWALPGLWFLPQESCVPECFLLGTGEPACPE